MVERSEQYKRSSYCEHAWGEAGWMVPHEEYQRLDTDTSGRCAAYRELSRYKVPDDDIHLIRKAIMYSQPLGDARFRRQIEAKYGRWLGYIRSVRPKSDDEALVIK